MSAPAGPDASAPIPALSPAPTPAASPTPAVPWHRQLQHNIGHRRAWAVWAAGICAYALAVFYRSSLGVAGIVAAERFHISSSQLATFTVLQLLVYAGMQVPVGVLLDRYGSRALISAGLLLMLAGQVWFAFASSFTTGAAARVLLGAGDAMTFVSVLRLVTVWFSVKQIPVVSQVTGMVGQVGSLAAALPLSAALHTFGWSPTFLVSASFALVALASVLLVLKNSPYRGTPVERIRARALYDNLRAIWGNPGTRLGLWTHFTSQFGTTVFTLLWGYPFLVAGEGLDPSAASIMLMVMTVTSMVSGPLIGRFTAHHPFHRSTLVLVMVAVMAGMWALVLLWPGRAPLPVLLLLVISTAVGGPGSMVGFDLARTFVEPKRYGRASGVVNIGGFIASLCAMGLIGVILDHLAPAGPSSYTLGDFRVAMSVQLVFWCVGATQMIRYRGRARRYLMRNAPQAYRELRHLDQV